MEDEIIQRARKIKLLLMDCDGVLTDGRLYFGENGETIKVFNVKDGQGIVNWHRAGYKSGIISGRNSKIVEQRANELGVAVVKQGSVSKTSDFEEILRELNIGVEEVAFIGDDLPDVPLLQLVGLSAAVANAVSAVKENSLLITKQDGGNGAVRELIDFLLAAKCCK